MIRDKDRRATLVHNFIAGHEYEVVVRAVGPDGVQEARESAARATIMIKGKQTTPSPPTDLATDGYLTSILLTWVNPLDYDVKHVEIWRATTNALALAVKIANVTGITYIDAIGASNSTRYYWLRAVNTSGEVSDYTDSVVGTSSGIAATDIDDFSVVATKMFTNTVILSGDVWSNNTPGGGSIAWNAHYITFGGAYYLISAGNTALRYVTWTEGDTGGSGTVADPYLSSYAGGASWTAVVNKFNIAVNESGIHQLVWNSSANMVIGSAFILDAAIVEAKIGNLAVTSAKILSLDAPKINVGVLTGQTLQTAASGQRIVVDGPSNKLSFFVGAGAGTEVLEIDDNVESGLPGIKMSSGGILHIEDGSDYVDVVAGQIAIEGTAGITVVEATTTASIAATSGIYYASYEGAVTGNFIIGRLNAVTKFAVNQLGNITTVGTVDGVDISAHAANVNAHHARSHNNTYHSTNYAAAAITISAGGALTGGGNLTQNRTISHPTFGPQFGTFFDVGNKRISYDVNGHVSVREIT